jgi:hypothetical protein
MEARATLRGARISNSVVVTFIVALLAAFLLGGAGGYLVRAVTIPASNTNSPSVTQTVPQQTLLPNQSSAKTLPQQTLLPNHP